MSTPLTISNNGSLEVLQNDSHINASLGSSASNGVLMNKVMAGSVSKAPMSHQLYKTKVAKITTEENGAASFKIESTKLSNGNKHEVWRTFKEFMWLDYQIRTYHHKEYRIFPPLPISGSGKKNHEARSRVASKIIDDCSIDCEVLSQYLCILCCHPRFCSSEFLKSFLTAPHPITLPSHMPSSLPTQCKYKLPSTSNASDQFFIKECTFLSNYEPAITNCSSTLKKLVFKTSDFAEIWAANSILLQSSADCSAFNKYLTLFAEVAHDLQFHSISARDCDEISLGVTLSFNSILINEEKRLLELWHQLVNKCCNIQNQINKQSQGSTKQKQLTDDLLRTESELETVGDQCKAEIAHYKQERDRSLRQSIFTFAHKQLHIAQQLENSLRTSLLKLKES